MQQESTLECDLDTVTIFLASNRTSTNRTSMLGVFRVFRVIQLWYYSKPFDVFDVITLPFGSCTVRGGAQTPL